jgi:hypothetical protein
MLGSAANALPGAWLVRATKTATATPIKDLRPGDQPDMVAAACRALDRPRSWLCMPMLVWVRTYLADIQIVAQRRIHYS